jgi:hypothetical protein
MEPIVEIYVPSRLYVRVGWAAVGGAAVCALCGLRAPLALIPGLLCILTAAAIFWLANRPPIRVSDSQLNIGQRAIAWREIREINSSRFVSPLVLKLRLTNSRSKVLIYPGTPERIARLMHQLRKLSKFATFDGVAYRDYWTWNDIREQSGEEPDAVPTRMVSEEEEEEIERLYQKLRGVGRFDSRKEDSKTPHED